MIPPPFQSRVYSLDSLDGTSAAAERGHARDGELQNAIGNDLERSDYALPQCQQSAAEGDT